MKYLCIPPPPSEVLVEELPGKYKKHLCLSKNQKMFTVKYSACFCHSIMERYMNYLWCKMINLEAYPTYTSCTNFVILAGRKGFENY
jgi:hypothetical protein